MELRLLLAAVRRFGHFVISFAALGLLIGTVVGGDREPTATARATIALDPNGGRAPGAPTFVGDPDRYVEGELSILGSRSIAAAAAETMPDVSAGDIDSSVTVSQRAGSSLVDITAEAGSSAQARQMADAVANAYLERRVAVVGAEVQRRRESVEAELAQVQAELEMVQARLVGPTPPPADIIRRETLLRRYDQLLGIQAELLEVSLPADRTQIIEPAVNVPGDAGLSSLLATVAGLVGGAVLGAAAAVALVAAFPRVMDRQHAEEIVGLPAVLDLGIRSSAGSTPGSVPGRSVAAVHRLAAAIAAEPAARLPRTIAVCSPDTTADAMTVAAALSAALVSERFHVAHLTVDLSPPAVSDDDAGSSAAIQLEDWELHRSSPLLDVVHPLGLREQAVNAEQVENLRKLLDERTDVIVIALPGLLESASSVSIAHTVDDVALVVPLRQQSEPELVLARRVLLEVPTSRVHLVVSRRPGLVRRIVARTER